MLTACPQAALTDGLVSIDHQMLRLLLRHSVMPLIKHVPVDQRCEL